MAFKRFFGWGFEVAVEPVLDFVCGASSSDPSVEVGVVSQCPCKTPFPFGDAGPGHDYAIRRDLPTGVRKAVEVEARYVVLVAVVGHVYSVQGTFYSTRERSGAGGCLKPLLDSQGCAVEAPLGRGFSLRSTRSG